MCSSDADEALAAGIGPPLEAVSTVRRTVGPAPGQPGARVLAFVGRAPDREAQVVVALADAASRRPGAAATLYDLINLSVFRLALAITDDPETAERATVASFVDIWTHASARPAGAGTAWVLDVACRCSRSTLAGDRRAARGLHVVPD